MFLRLHHRPVELPWHSYSNHQRKRQHKAHMKTNSTWVPLCNSPSQGLILQVCSQCREENIVSNSKHCSIGLKVHRLRRSANGQCMMQRCKRTSKTSSIDSIFWRNLPWYTNILLNQLISLFLKQVSLNCPITSDQEIQNECTTEDHFVGLNVVIRKALNFHNYEK